jgi:hypothetical protein
MRALLLALQAFHAGILVRIGFGGKDIDPMISAKFLHA